MDGNSPPPLTRGATVRHPLLGLTILLVEDSRHASEAVRLMCQRSGARLRRADSLAAARRHLRVYRPGAVIVDIGLPDGSGLTFLRELALAQPRIDVIIATSADAEADGAAIEAGADTFLAKPVADLATFQAAFLGYADKSFVPHGAVDFLPDESAAAMSLRDDFVHVVQLLKGPEVAGKAGYLAQFLQGIAANIGDNYLNDIARELGRAFQTDGPSGRSIKTEEAGTRRLATALARLGDHLEIRLGQTTML